LAYTLASPCLSHEPKVRVVTRSNGTLAKRNLSRSLALPTITAKVVESPQMMFINPIMTTHVNRNAN